MKLDPQDPVTRELLRNQRYAEANSKIPPGDLIDLSTIPREDLPQYDCRGILPSPAIARYLASGDPLTHDAINKMELALEEHYKIPPGFYITSARKGGDDGKALSVAHFLLMVDPE